MALSATVEHAFTSAIPDDPAALAAGEVTPSRWNGTGAHTVAITGTASDEQLPDKITAGGPTGSATVVPVITYDAKGRLTAVTTAAITQPAGANPSASVGLSAVNGSAGTFMRSDAAPALDVSIAPTWTGLHTFTKKVTVTAGTLGDQAQAFSLTATQPTTPTGFQAAYLVTVTSAGSAGQNNNALSIQYNAGYTGSSGTSSMRAVNSVAGTGSTPIPAAESLNAIANFGFLGVANAATTGANLAGWGAASGGDLNIGLEGIAQVSKSGAGTKTNIGVVGSGYNAVTGGSTPVMVGVLGSLNQATLPTTSAAGIFDNGSQTSDILRLNDNNTNVWKCADGGDVTATGKVTYLSGTSIPAGGTTGAGIKVSSTSNFGVFFGSGAPSLSAAKGSLYLRSDGSGTGDRAYINTDGGTTWTALTTAA